MSEDIKTFFGKRMQYWTAKEIAEIFEYHDMEKEKLNSKAFQKEEDELWSVRGRRVTLEISKIGYGTSETIIVDTDLFNEFDDNPKTKYKTISDHFEDNNVTSISDYAKVIEDYFKYFEDDYSCEFGYFDRRK